MLDFLGKRLQKSLGEANKKTTLKEEDILKITRDIKMSLLEADVNLKVVKDFINNIKEKIVGQDLMSKLNPGQQMVKIVKEELIITLGNKVKEIKINTKPYIIMMTGLQGGGKTTTTAKLANYFRTKKQADKILLVAADIYRPAAVEQLVTLAKSINIDYFEMGTKNPVEEIINKALEKAKEEKYDLVIIDTAGRLSIDEKLMDELVVVKNIAKPNQILFVADALSGQDIINVATTFHEYLNLTGSIITKLDSDARGGAALSIRYLLKIPISFIGTGEKISNLDLFHPDRMAERILGMG
ncbi:MAG: signal recognition particle receptor subunit alpha, partial [Mycoplasmataceae bacterium]|nr:signal recognition particle receptor subunit alpha [Mycoplasmataceae bacterium]